MKASRPISSARGAFLAQQSFHLQLGGDARMIGAGHPERRLALHARAADHQIFQADEHDMAHMQLAGDIGRGDGDDKRFGISRAGLPV